MQIRKMTQMLSGLISLLFGLMICLALVGFALLPDRGSFVLFGATHDVGYKSSTVLWLVLMVIPIAAIEGGIWRLRASWAMQNLPEGPTQSPIWTGLAQGTLVISFVSTVLTGFVFLIVLIAEMLALLSFLTSNTLVLSVPLVGLLGISMLYVLVRIPLLFIQLVSHGKSSSGLGGIERYRLTGGGVEINLGFVQIGSRQAPDTFFVGFDELDEMQVLSYMEVETYLNYKVGPNVELQVRQAQEQYRFLKGEIPRPSVYFLSAKSIGGVHVLMRGPELFYVFRFKNDASDLIDAFKRHKGLSPTELTAGKMA